MTKVSPRHIEYLVQLIRAAGLNVPAGFFGELERLQRCYNGIGPEHWSSRFRGLTTALLVQFEPAALVHDWEYSYSTKTYWAFTAANSRFLYNCIRIAVLDYGFSRLTVNQIRLAICLAVLCQLFGWNGFKKTEIEK